MTMLVDNLVEEIGEDYELEFRLCHIITNDGLDIFSDYAEYKDKCILKTPFCIEMKDDKTLMFREYSPFTESEFFIVNTSTLQSVSKLSNRFIKLYLDAIDQHKEMLSSLDDRSSASLTDTLPVGSTVH